eukprot:g35785.t1
MQCVNFLSSKTRCSTVAHNNHSDNVVLANPSQIGRGPSKIVVLTISIFKTYLISFVWTYLYLILSKGRRRGVSERPCLHDLSVNGVACKPCQVEVLTKMQSCKLKPTVCCTSGSYYGKVGSQSQFKFRLGLQTFNRESAAWGTGTATPADTNTKIQLEAQSLGRGYSLVFVDAAPSLGLFQSDIHATHRTTVGWWQLLSRPYLVRRLFFCHNLVCGDGGVGRLWPCLLGFTAAVTVIMTRVAVTAASVTG